MTRKKLFLPGEDIVQSGQFQVCVEAVFCNESCTMLKLSREPFLLLFDIKGK